MTHTSASVNPPAREHGTDVMPLPKVGSLKFSGPRSRAEQLANALDERIKSGGLKSGDFVGTLQGLREETGYARATVSEAVRLLREREIVDIRPGRGGGLYVAETSPGVRLRRTLLQVSEQPSAVMDAIELRDHLEELIDVGASRCRTAADIRDLHKLLEEMEAAQEWDDFMRTNWALHARIAEICPNSLARAVYVSTLGHLSTSTSTRFDADAQSAVTYRADRYRMHAELVDAIATGDVQAVRTAVVRHNSAS